MNGLQEKAVHFLLRHIRKKTLELFLGRTDFFVPG